MGLSKNSCRLQITCTEDRSLPTGVDSIAFIKDTKQKSQFIHSSFWEATVFQMTNNGKSLMETRCYFFKLTLGNHIKL